MEVVAHDGLKLLIRVANFFKANHPILILVKNSKTMFKYIFAVGSFTFQTSIFKGFEKVGCLF